MSLVEYFECVERRLNRSTRGPLLERRHHYAVEFAQLIDHSRWISLGIVGLHEIIGAGKNIVDARPTGMDDERCVNAIASPHRSKQKTFRNVVGVAPPRANSCSRLLTSVVKQPAHLLGVKTCNTTRRSSGAHGSNQV